MNVTLLRNRVFVDVIRFRVNTKSSNRFPYKRKAEGDLKQTRGEDVKTEADSGITHQGKERPGLGSHPNPGEPPG